MDPQWIATAFSAVNSIRAVFYLPQIVAVVRSVDGARDISLWTWAMWAVTNAIGVAYGAVVVADPMLAASFACCLLGCLATIVLTLGQRLRFAAARQLARSSAASKSRAFSQSRRTVRSVTPSASAISASFMPPK